jgi:DNA repair exonuclease SbcCD nuclease subunit
MARPLRILHTADSHIGAGLPARPRHRRPRRGDDFLSSYRRVLAAAGEHDVDLVIHAGDLFDVPRPTSQALAAAAAPLLELAAAGVAVVVVPGNHERSTIPSSLLLTHPRIHIVTGPCTLAFDLRGLRLAVSALPAAEHFRHGLLGRDAGGFAAALEATGWRTHEADVRVLAVHEAFESASCGPANYRFRPGPGVVERSLVPADFHYVACGHVHRHQALAAAGSDGPSIVYSGSPDRITFAEMDEPKGCVLMEAGAAGVSWRFLEHEVRPLSVWPLNVTGLTRQAIEGCIEDILQRLPAQAVAQVRLSGFSERAVLGSVRFTELAWTRRPDVLMSVSAGAVQRAASGGGAAVPPESPFACLRAPAATEVQVPAGALKLVPAACGVYTLHDGAGRLLYAGKARNLRARLRGHFGRAAGNFFRGWSREAAGVRVRLADSELEALLLEAELIRRLRPPFNLQMRQWTRYCYLMSGAQPHGQLDIVRHPPRRGLCFGPFRGRRWARTLQEALAREFLTALCPAAAEPPVQLSLFPRDTVNLCERYYAGCCAGPCAGREAPAAYAARLLRRDALLAGLDDSRVIELEQEAATMGGAAPDARDRGGLAGLAPAAGRDGVVIRASILRRAFDWCQSLREARSMMDGLLILPGGDLGRKAMMADESGLRFVRVEPTLPAAAAALAEWRRCVGLRRGQAAVPRTILDALCIAVRVLRRPGAEYRFIERSALEHMSARQLLAEAFGGVGGGTDCRPSPPDR